MVQIASIISGTRAEGPGRRVAIWTQGCTIKCAGCFNPELWGVHGGTSYSAEDLFRAVEEAIEKYPDIEGVTLLGGEPFDQAEDLFRFARLVRKQGLSVMVFSGFTLEQLQTRADSATKKFLDEIDLLVDGPFESDQIDNARPWVGSMNQQFRFLSGRYDDKIFGFGDRIEITISRTGEIHLNGWADRENLDAILEGFA